MMKWTILLKEFKEKIGYSQAPSTSASTDSTNNVNNTSPSSQDYALLPSGEGSELELDLRRRWQEFSSSNSEKEKKKALNWTVEIFHRLVNKHSDVAQLVSRLVETHIFCFVLGRAFVTDIEKLKISSKTKALEVERVLNFFSETAQDGIKPGANLLHAVEVLVSVPIDKQSFLDSGILCCLVYVLNALLTPDGGSQRKISDNDEKQPPPDQDHDIDSRSNHRHEVEGSVVNIMKTLATHPSAAQSLIEDNSFELLFQIVANGSLVGFLPDKECSVPLQASQLHIHAMQILRLLLVNDNGSTAKYIHKHHMIKVLLMAVKDFSPNRGDPAYTMSIVDLLLECVLLSHRSGVDATRLREDIHNAHGYQFLVQFALTLSKNQAGQILYSKSFSVKNSTSYSPHAASEAETRNLMESGNNSLGNLSPILSRLLDVIVDFAQTGPSDVSRWSELKASKSSDTGSGREQRSLTSSSDQIVDETQDKDIGKVKDLEAIQMLQDILIKAESRELQAEVLNILFKIFSSHLENYKLCQQLRTVPLLILNMAGLPPSLQKIILKILEYVVTVVNIIPEQELLSLCCLLQQPITSDLKKTILSFFVKILSFHQQYKKILREVGVLEVLIDDLQQHKFLGPEPLSEELNHPEKKASSISFKKHLDSKDTILSSPKLLESGPVKFPIFEVEGTIAVAWDCLVFLLKKDEANQAYFRYANGVTVILPFLTSDTHRSGVLRVLSCLIIDDVNQDHSEELGTLIEVLKSGIVTSTSGSQYILQDDAKCDAFGALWRILGVNGSAQRVFGEAIGFSLLVTTLHGFKRDAQQKNQPSIDVYINVFTYLLRAMTAGVCDNAVNRKKLHAIISSQTFTDLLSDSGLICVACERQVIQLFLELALEIMLPPSMKSESAKLPNETEDESATFVLITPSGSFVPNKERVYNPAAIRVLIRALLLFSRKVQLELTNLIGELARSSSFNQESLTSIGCVELLLETIYPFLSSSSPLVSNSLTIVEVLGAYRLSVSELRLLVRYILQTRVMSSGRCLVEMMERMIRLEHPSSNDVSLAPFLELDMSKIGHGSIQVPLGERSWPPVAGYSFACWFQYKNLLTSQGRETEAPKFGSSKKQRMTIGQQLGSQVLRLFSVGAVDNGSTFFAEISLQEDGYLTLATSNSSSLSFSGLEMKEGSWHHLVVVHSKPNALAGLFQASVAYVYLNGKLRHTGKLGYSPSPAGKSLQVSIGTPITCGRISDLSWRLRSCYLFEEVLSPSSICFMYILGRGYRGLFQDNNLLQFVPIQACGGSNMAILDPLDTDLHLNSSMQKPDSAGKQGIFKPDRSELVWDSEKLRNLSVQLWAKKLIFAFDGTSTEIFRGPETLTVLNLVDPMSAAASPIGGIPRFGLLLGDIYVCKQCVIGDTIRPIGGIAVVLALVEAAETRDMLRMALTLLACALHQNPQNARDMQKYGGYHLLALFIHRRMSLLDIQSLEILFQIAACEASFSEPREKVTVHKTLSPTPVVNDDSFDEPNFSKFRNEFSSIGSTRDMDDFLVQKDLFSDVPELEIADMPTETSNCIVLSNSDMVDHVLLDWTIWVGAPVPIQLSLIGFLENLVSMHGYRNHNITILRKINLVQHLLVTLQRADVDVTVLEKLVVLLGFILEDGLLSSELELVVRFVIMTFAPKEILPHHYIKRESMGKHVIVRSMLLEMLIDLQVSIKSEELLEQWHKMVSSNIITYFLDEAVHPTSMKWVMTLLGVCLRSSSTFTLKFRSNGGFQGLTRVLPSLYDSPDIYYILFCLIFDKPVYPRLPEVRMLDFHALMPSDGSYKLKFVELLESVIAMAKSTFDRVCIQSMAAHRTGNCSEFFASLGAELVEKSLDRTGELQGEALMHKTYATRLMSGEASAPAAATSILRFMVDLAKMCPPFTAVCRRAEFLESCIDLYFSCARAAYAVRMAKEDNNLSNSNDVNSFQKSLSNLPKDQVQLGITSTSTGEFTQGSASVNEINSSSDSKTPSQDPNTLCSISPKLLLDVDDSGYGGGPCSAAVSAVLDFMAIVLSDLVTDQIKAAQAIETILESVPLYVDVESVLVFQGLCLIRLMNFLERRLLRDDEETEKRLDKNRWSLNLDALSWMIVDRAYMGAFAQPSGVLKTLEFLLSMLQLANKDGQIEEFVPTGKGLISIGRGSRQFDAYIHALFKNLNRMILFCFLPSFLKTIGEDKLLSRLGLSDEQDGKMSSNTLPEDGDTDIFSVLQLLFAHRRIVFCPSNLDNDINCCLCINLISLLNDHRHDTQKAALDILKYLLGHRGAALEDFLVIKSKDGLSLDVMHGGFDKILTGNISDFFEWFQRSLPVVNDVLDRNTATMWMKYIAGATKFPGARIKGVDSHREREMGRKSRNTLKSQQRHLEQVNERRVALEFVSNEMATELRVIRQDKYGWVLHAESEWQTHLQLFIHERGIFKISKSLADEEEPEWKLCLVEGPYRMRKKLERCKLKIDSLQNVSNEKFHLMEGELSKEATPKAQYTSDIDSDPLSNLLNDNIREGTLNAELYNQSISKDSEDAQDVSFAEAGWNNDQDSSINEASVYSTVESCIKSSSSSTQILGSTQGKSNVGSPRLSSLSEIDEVRVVEENVDKELNDNSEYLIRPYLERLEKIKYKYNCERVVGLDKRDGIFLIGELSLYVIENFYIDDSGCVFEKESEDDLSVIDLALGIKKDFTSSMDSHSKSSSSLGATMKGNAGGKAWAYSGGAWEMEKVHSKGNVPHLWHMWKLDNVHELLKRDYQLRPVAIEIFSIDGCNDLLAFHKKEREEIFRNLLAMNLPRNSILDTTISGSTKKESNEGSLLFKITAKSFSKRWQNGEISNFQYLMHLNTLAGRGYSDLTQYPVFPWVLADYESQNLNLSDPKSFRKFDKPMGCQTPEGEDEFRKRYASWDDPEVPKFHYGSHYSSAGIILFYLLRLPPFSTENQKLQGGQFDHADRLFNSIRDTWLSASGRGNTSDVKELIPEFFYLPEFLENRFNLDLGQKQSGEKVGDVILPPWAKGSAREFIRRHREALESDYVSRNLHHWIDLIFGYKQRGKAAEEAVNVFYHYTYEGSVDIDAITDPALKSSILAQINHFGQTPKQVFSKPHVKRKTERKLPPHLLKHSMLLVPLEMRKSSSLISQIVTSGDKILVAGPNNLLKPGKYTEYVAWGFPDRSLRFLTYDQDKLLSTHENLHGGNQIQCASASHDGQILATGADNGLICVWRIEKEGPDLIPRLDLEKALCAHTCKITCLQVCQPYMMIVSGSDDCTVILWDLCSLAFVRQLPEFPSPVSAIYMNDMTGEIVTGAGVMLAVWSINGDCLAVVNASQLSSDLILSLAGCTFSDWLETNWWVSGHQSKAVKVWKMVHHTCEQARETKENVDPTEGLELGGKVPEYRLILTKVLKSHKFPITALYVTSDLKQLLSGDSNGHLISWTLPDESSRFLTNKG